MSNRFVRATGSVFSWCRTSAARLRPHRFTFGRAAASRRFNSGAGINAVAGSNQNIVSIKNSVFARNGAVGVQANGVNAGVLLQTTLLDQNVAGATSVVSGGNIFTYGNNSIIGSSGSGFTATATLH